jgi:hypothetical protein
MFSLYILWTLSLIANTARTKITVDTTAEYSIDVENNRNVSSPVTVEIN